MGKTVENRRDMIPTSWIKEKMHEYKNPESTMWARLMRLWDDEVSGYCDEGGDTVQQEPAPEDAHWIKKGHESECSNCGRRELWMNAAVYEFCPHCGKSMKEPPHIAGNDGK